MAFVLTVDSQSLEGLEVLQDGNGWITAVNVGYDDETPLLFSIVAGLSPSGGGTVEFYFYFVEVDSGTGEERLYWSGRDVSRFVGSEDRRIIRDVLEFVTSAMLSKARPINAFMVSYDENPPDKAIIKYDILLLIFKHLGYKVERGDDYHGKYVWTMERPE